MMMEVMLMAQKLSLESINTITKQQFNTKIEFIMRTQLLLLNEFMYLVLCVANKIAQLLQ